MAQTSTRTLIVPYHRRELDGEMQRLSTGVAAAAKRAEVVERFAALDEGIAGAAARSERLAAQTSATDESLAQLQATLRTKASAADLSGLRADLDAQVRSCDDPGAISTRAWHRLETQARDSSLLALTPHPSLLTPPPSPLTPHPSPLALSLRSSCRHASYS